MSDGKNTELDTPAPSQAEIDALLNPDNMSGKQLEALRKMDEKNVDREDLGVLMAGMLDAYNAAKNSV